MLSYNRERGLYYLAVYFSGDYNIIVHPLHVLDLGVEMDNEKVCTSVGAQAVITCTANYPDNQVTTPYVKFYKLSGSESQLISVSLQHFVT